MWKIETEMSAVEVRIKENDLWLFLRGSNSFIHCRQITMKHVTCCVF